MVLVGWPGVSAVPVASWASCLGLMASVMRNVQVHARKEEAPMLRTLNSEGRLSLAVQGFQNRRGIEVQGVQNMQWEEQAMDCLELADCWMPLLSAAMV